MDHGGIANLTAEALIDFRFVTANGESLHCAMAGPTDGPLVILLHGFPEFWFGWREYFAPLARRGFRVVAPDQRGYNLSSKPAAVDAYRLAAAAADAFALATAFGRSHSHVVGHDWGAAVAWTMAGLDPRRLTSATMIQAPHPAIWLRALREDPEQRRKGGYVRILALPWLPEISLKLGNFALLERALRSTTRPEAFPPEALDAYRESWRQPGALTGMLNWYRAALAGGPPPPPAPRSLKPPILILWGDQDAYAVPSLAEASAALCANARLRRFPRATHWIIHDAPEVVCDALLDHL